jgi:hypothetical protein
MTKECAVLLIVLYNFSLSTFNAIILRHKFSFSFLSFNRLSKKATKKLFYIASSSSSNWLRGKQQDASLLLSTSLRFITLTLQFLFPSLSLSLLSQKMIMEKCGKDII